MKAMSDLGLSPTAIARRMGKSHNTVIKYLDSEVYNDPEIGKMVERIREKEIEDLYLLGAKARKCLHDLVDEGDTKPIETIALMDRAFQQRRLLEGLSTQNLQGLTKIILEADSYERKYEDRTGEASHEIEGQKEEAEGQEEAGELEGKDS